MEGKVMEYTYTKSKIVLTKEGIETRVKVRQHFREDENGNEILIKEEVI